MTREGHTHTHRHVLADGSLGRSCSIIEPTEEEATRLEARTQELLRQKIGTNAMTVQSGGIVDVYFHVITDNSGNYDVSDSVIDDQMDVLNDAFADGGWQFNLVSVDRTSKTTFANMDMGLNAESNCKAELHQGGTTDLNIYTAN
jgi:hypothetical protein